MIELVSENVYFRRFVRFFCFKGKQRQFAQSYQVLHSDR